MRRATTSRTKGKRSRPKTKLGIPDLEHSKAAVLRSLGSADSARGYQHAIEEFVAWHCSELRLAFNKTVVLRYRFHLGELDVQATFPPRDENGVYENCLVN